MVVASVGRNDPCPCGSGRKAKRCCGVARGPSEESEAHAFLVHASRDAAATLRSRSDRELLDLFDGLWDLPQTDISLQAELPKVFSPELSRLCEVVLDKSADGPLLDAVTQQLDTPLQRARLARAVIAQERRGTIGHRLAAAALVDLASSSRQLLRRSVLEAVAVRVGAVRTPGGLMVAA
jgi:hypothetical protein